MRTELLETVYAEKPHEVEQLLARLRLWNFQDPLLFWAGDWAMRRGENEPAPSRDAQRVDRRHPFIEELNKEGFNLLGDFEAAMASKAYHDACQIKASHDYFSQVGRLAFRRCDSLQQFISVTIEKNTGFRQVNPPTDTSKKRDPEFDFQFMDLIRHIGLTHAEFLSGSGKAREASDRFEYSEPCNGERGWRIRALESWVVLHKDSAEIANW